MKQALLGAKIFDGDRFYHQHALIIDGESIVGIVEKDQIGDLETIELNGGVLAPGFIDLQVNGGGDILFNNDTSEAAVHTMVKGHRTAGTTSMMPTLITDTHKVHAKALEAIDAAVKSGNKGVMGVHIEGPFFGLKRRGTHKEEYIRKIDQADIDWMKTLKGFKVMVTLAPEIAEPGQIKAMSDAGIYVNAGHTDAYYDDVKNAIDEGLKGFTHLFNAMRPQLGREPGVVGAALESQTTWCGIIVDGHHVHPASVRAAYAAKPQGKLYLVSDSMATIGGKKDHFEIYGETIYVKDGALVNAEGNLAGSAIGMIDAVRVNTTLVGMTLEETLRMSSLYPAQFMEVDDQLGRLKSGYRADLVHFTDEFDVTGTWVAGDFLSNK